MPKTIEGKIDRFVEALGSMSKMASKMGSPQEPLSDQPPFTLPKGAKVEHWQSLLGGKQVRISFPNDYVASVVCHSGSYGGGEGLWELAVFHKKEEGLVYDTPITDDVEGRLTVEAVNELLVRMAALPERP